jgi:hypothetical protein
MKLSELWKEADFKERGEFVKELCQYHSALLCHAIIEQGICKLFWLKKCLFDNKELEGK